MKNSLYLSKAVSKRAPLSEPFRFMVSLAGNPAFWGMQININHISKWPMTHINKQSSLGNYASNHKNNKKALLLMCIFKFSSFAYPHSSLLKGCSKSFKLFSCVVNNGTEKVVSKKHRPFSTESINF